MHLLINLAVIRLSLQIVIPGIMIIFKRQKAKHQHPSLLSPIPATTRLALDGRHGGEARARAPAASPQRGSLALKQRCRGLGAWFKEASVLVLPLWPDSCLRQRNHIDIIRILLT